MNMNVEQFYQFSDDELIEIKGGFTLAEAVGFVGLLNAAVKIFNIGYKFGSETEIQFSCYIPFEIIFLVGRTCVLPLFGIFRITFGTKGAVGVWILFFQK